MGQTHSYGSPTRLPPAAQSRLGGSNASATPVTGRAPADSRWCLRSRRLFSPVGTGSSTSVRLSTWLRPRYARPCHLVPAAVVPLGVPRHHAFPAHTRVLSAVLRRAAINRPSHPAGHTSRAPALCRPARNAPCANASLPKASGANVSCANAPCAKMLCANAPCAKILCANAPCVKANTHSTQHSPWPHSALACRDLPHISLRTLALWLVRNLRGVHLCCKA
eukprot:358969-Chlamydomonas_euryale.AAC.3